MSEATTTPRLIVMSAIIFRRIPDGSNDLKNCLSCRISTESSDAVVGRYVLDLLAQFPGWSLLAAPNYEIVQSADLARVLGEWQP